AQFGGHLRDAMKKHKKYGNYRGYCAARTKKSVAIIFLIHCHRRIVCLLLPRMSTSLSSNRPGGGIKWQWPAIHPEGRKFLVIAGVITLVFWLLGWEIAGWLALGVTIWIGSFFRDPKRITPLGDDLIIAPADGLITQISDVAPPAEIAGPDGLTDTKMVRVSIFMSVFDVHINRTPVAGTLIKLVYMRGKFLNADL